MMPKNLAIAYHNLSNLLEAGVPLLRSLNTITPGLKPKTRKAFLDLADGVAQGNPISEKMVLHPKIFCPVDIMLVEVGEKSGNLPDLIGLLSKWHEMSHRMFKKMLAGLLLPALILFIAAFVFPFPNFVLGGWDLKTYLLKAFGILTLFWVPAVIIILIICMTPKTGPLRRLLDQTALRIPILGTAIHKLAISRFCWAFSMLCKAGVPIDESADMAVSVTGNAVVADLFRPAAECVKAGRIMSEGFSTKLPQDLVEMWKTSEETGQLDDMSKRLADNYSQQAEFWFAEFSRWFPRFVYLLICIMLILMILKRAGNMRSMY